MDHTATAVATLGWIVAVKRDGDRLMELHQFLGESARDIGLRNKVSLGIDPSFVDGKGIRYGEAIVHSAVTPVPVVPDQGEFEPVNLSDEVEENGDVIELSLLTTTTMDIDPITEIEKDEPIELAGVTHGPEDPVTMSVPPSDNADHLHLAIDALKQVAAVKRDLALSRGALDPAVAERTIRPARATPRWRRQHAAALASKYRLIDRDRGLRRALPQSPRSAGRDHRDADPDPHHPRRR